MKSLLSPVQVENLATGKFLTVPNRFVTGRFDYTTGYMHNWEVVKGRYEIIPNSVIASKALALDNGDTVHIDRAGVLDDGRKFYVSLKCPNDTINEETYNNHIVVMTSHDGSSPISYSFASVRAITGTTYRLDISAPHAVKKKHTPSNESKPEEVLSEVKSVLDGFTQWRASHTLKMNEYLSYSMSIHDVDNILQLMWPIDNANTVRKQKHREEVIDTVNKLYRSEYNLGNNALSLISSIFDYYDNYRNIDADDLAQQALEIDNHTYRQKLKASKIINEYIKGN